LRRLVRPGFFAEALDAHFRVVIVEEVAFGGQRRQGFIDRFQGLTALGHQFPLGRGGQGHALILLYLVQAIVGQAGAETPIAQRRPDPRIIFA